MKHFRLTLPILMLLSSAGFAQFGGEMKLAPATQNKFTGMPGIPECVTLAPANGDPTKSGYVMTLKLTAGCVAPWHWHSADENVMMITGHGKLETKDGGTKTVAPGDYAYMPSKHPHQLTCTTLCTLFLSSPQAFDIHYIDASGNEISAEQALKASARPMAAKKPGAGKKTGEERQH